METNESTTSTNKTNIFLNTSNKTSVCKYKDIEGHCIVVLQLANDYFYTTPEECDKCRKCNLIKDDMIRHGHLELPKDGGVNDFTIYQSSLLGVTLRPDLIGRGPGTILKTVISWFVDQPPGCDCELRSKIMDLWGYEQCRANEKTIRSWLRESTRIHCKYVPDVVITSILKGILWLEIELPAVSSTETSTDNA